MRRSRIDSGTKTFGRTPSVVPVKPRGATPMTVIGTPLTIRVSPMTAGLIANRVCQ